MRAQQTGVRPRLLLLTALLAALGGFGMQQASAQTFTNLTSVLILRQMPLNDTEIKADMEGLQQKLLPLQNETSRSSVQLALLSPRSRARLNTLTGATLEFLQNRTDSQLAEILESIRAANYRRFMAINVVYSSLPRAFSSSNVLGMLQALQIEDLERLASLPLAEDKYQKLTNVTLLEMLNQIFNYGATQVQQRTCVLTAANTSTVAPLIQATTSNFARHRRSLLRSQSLQETLQEHLQDMHRRLLEQGALREAVVSAAQEELQALPATFFRPYRRLQQQQDAAGTAEDPTDAPTVGSIVDDYLRGVELNQTGSGVVPNFTAPGGPPYIQQVPETNPDGSVVGSDGQIFTPVNFTDVEGLADQLSARDEQELPPPPPVEDTESGWSMPMDVYDPCENGTAVDGANCEDLYALEYGVETPPAASDAPGNTPGTGDTPSSGSVGLVNATQQQALVNCSSTRVNASIMLNISCSNGTSFTRALDPCSLTVNRTVVDTAACAALGPCLPNNTYAASGEPCDASVPPCTQWRATATLTVTVTCRNGTTFNRTRDPCLLRPNGTIISEAACFNLGPCLPNGTYAGSGEPCNYTDAASRCIQDPAGSALLNGTSNVTCIPCVNGATPEGLPCGVAPLNSTQEPCVNGTDAEGLPCNATSNSSSPCVNGTTADGLPCNSSSSISPAPCLNGTTADGEPCNVTVNSLPCVNGTTLDGLPCNSSSEEQAPCVNGTTADGLPCNATATNSSSREEPCVNGTTADGTPCNTTATATNSSSREEPCVNGTAADGTPCNTTATATNSSSREEPCVNGTAADGTPCNTTATPPTAAAPWSHAWMALLLMAHPATRLKAAAMHQAATAAPRVSTGRGWSMELKCHAHRMGSSCQLTPLTASTQQAARHRHSLVWTASWCKTAHRPTSPAMTPLPLLPTTPLPPPTAQNLAPATLPLRLRQRCVTRMACLCCAGAALLRLQRHRSLEMARTVLTMLHLPAMQQVHHQHRC
ncbi:hypothetical protein COO60DRAFT_19075 [Scenedesmus sp. NREL 46B-D3]|nr:hypothetical protein COO60DRAFT_19075 [Scenedesmus sp. NREL 46B-D3]